MKLLVKGDDNPRVVQVGRTRDARKWMRQYGQAGEVGEVWREADWNVPGGRPQLIIRMEEIPTDPALEVLTSWKALLKWLAG